MSTPNDNSAALRAPLWILPLAFLGALSALAGGYWDDAWHTERGRDDFFIAPHIAIYAGVAAAGAALSLWALIVVRAQGIRAAWAHRPLALGLISVGVTLASAPIDNVWHEAFGRDAVIWSPPHMLGIAGTLALGAALLAELAGRPEVWAPRIVVIAGSLVLAAAGFATVEYDTDVPQFDEVFYLPVLAFAVSVGFVLVQAASRFKWAAASAAAVYTVFIGGVSIFLAAIDFAPPALPLVLPAALAADVARRREWTPPATAAAVVFGLHIAYVPVRNLLGEGVRFDGEDIALGAGLAWAAASAVFAVASGWRPRSASLALLAAVSVVLLALASAPDARSHDPGQGDDAGMVAWKVAVRGQAAEVSVGLPSGSCRDTQLLGFVARRAGRSVRAPATRHGCDGKARLDLPDRGRWFVYLEMRRAGRPVESWIPITAGSNSADVRHDARYAYFPPTRSGSAAKTVAGIALYLGVLVLLVATLRLVQTTRHEAASVQR